MHNVPNRPARTRQLALTAAILLCAAGLALAQNATPRRTPASQIPTAIPATQEAQDSRIVKIFQAKYTSANHLENPLRAAFPNCRVIPDSRANTVVVTGSSSDIHAIEALIPQLDVPEKTKQDTVRIYQLKHRPTDETLSNLLERTLNLGTGPNSHGSYAMDRARRLLIVSADESVQKELSNLLAALDSPPPSSTDEPAPSFSTVSVAWLVAGPENRMKNLPPFSSDLENAVVELKRICNFEAARALARCVINISGKNRFELETTITGLMETPSHLKITGDSDISQGKPILNLEISASGLPGSPVPTPEHPAETFKIKTSIVMTLGQDAVLGVSPTGDVSSAFVVRILK